MAILVQSKTRQRGAPEYTLGGYTKQSGLGKVFGGQPVAQVADATGAGTVFAFANGGEAFSSSYPPLLGLLIENSYTGFPMGAFNGAGAAGEQVNNARGGLHSIVCTPGNYYDVFDDGSDTTQVTVNGASQNASCPIVANLTFVVGQALYATTSAVGLGYITNVASSSGTLAIGFVDAVNSAGQASPTITIRYFPFVVS